MWNKPFGYSEYNLIGVGLIATGLMLQISVGAIDWSLISFPANIVMLCIFIALLITMNALKSKVYLFRALSEVRTAVVSISFVASLTLIMGLIKQDGQQISLGEHFSIGLNSMLHAWWFVLPFIWMTICLGMTALRRTFPFRTKNIPFMLNHWGLFIALTCATLGNADIQQLTMQTFPGKAEWRATDDNGMMHELPLAIELQQFSIEQYPARIMIIDNQFGKAQPEKKPQLLTTEEKRGKILDWQIELRKYYEYAAPVEMNDSVKYVRWGSSGATDAALVTATNIKTHLTKSGWISCGSYLFPFNTLKLSDGYSLVMAEREPKKFSSAVKVYTRDERIIKDTIEVNKPLNVMGWKIYQLDYDKEKGRWSEASIFKLVKDPWLPSVYVGIFMMLAGAVCLFIRKNDNR